MDIIKSVQSHPFHFENLILSSLNDKFWLPSEVILGSGASFILKLYYHCLQWEAFKYTDFSPLGDGILRNERYLLDYEAFKMS